MFCLRGLRGVIIFRNFFSFGFINNPGVEYHQHQKKHPQKLLTPIHYNQGLFPVSALCQIRHVDNPILSGMEPFYTLLFILPALMPQIKISKMSFLKKFGQPLINSKVLVKYLLVIWIKNLLCSICVVISCTELNNYMFLKPFCQLVI